MSGWIGCIMVLVLDGNAALYALVCRITDFFFSINLKFATADNLNKCLKYTKLPNYLYTCAPKSVLPSYKSTIGCIGSFFTFALEKKVRNNTL